MRKTVWFVAPIFAFLVGMAPALATGDHHEERDGCDHGHTSKPCRPDPQPDHGKDCVKHGNHGGINEDHCADTTTTTEPQTTTTTAPPNVTTTTVTTGTDSKVISVPSTTSTTSPLSSTPAPLNVSPATNLSGELPRTGQDAGLLFVVGMALLAGGLSTWFAGKAM